MSTQSSLLLTMSQRYLLANKARTKLMQCVSSTKNRDYDLRVLVGHANLLDSVMDSIHNHDLETTSQPAQESYFSSDSESDSDEEDEDYYYSSSDEEESNGEDSTYEYVLASTNTLSLSKKQSPPFFSTTNISTTLIASDDEDDEHEVEQVYSEEQDLANLRPVWVWKFLQKFCIPRHLKMVSYASCPL